MWRELEYYVVGSVVFPCGLVAQPATCPRAGQRRPKRPEELFRLSMGMKSLRNSCNALNSYLVQRLDGSVGSRMPIGGAALDNIDMTNIMNWINTGAPNN